MRTPLFFALWIACNLSPSLAAPEQWKVVWSDEFDGGKLDHTKWATEENALPKGAFADDFHVVAMEWEKGAIRWYVDGELYQTQTKWNGDGGAFPAPFDQPFYLILNISVGGQWPGPPDVKTEFPQRMLVD